MLLVSSFIFHPFGSCLQTLLHGWIPLDPNPVVLCVSNYIVPISALAMSGETLNLPLYVGDHTAC